MAQPGPGPIGVKTSNGRIVVEMWDEKFVLYDSQAERLANMLYDALGIEHVTRSTPIPNYERHVDEFADIHTKSSDALDYADEVAAIMKLHGFSFDQAMLIVGVAKGGE